MQNQTPLPFPESASTPADGPSSPAPLPPAPGRRPPAAARRPWWTRLLGRLLEPWIAVTVEPESPGDYAREWTGGPVCYVLEDYGLSNALILERACREYGLPSPMQPLPGVRFIRKDNQPGRRQGPRCIYNHKWNR